MQIRYIFECHGQIIFLDNSEDNINFRYEWHGNQNSVERVLCEINRWNITSQTVSAALKQKLLTSGSDRLPSHGISLS